ncbi:hypothetical protein PHMEG_00035956 [Phytophthora megakarya]|uniref:Uncharacterized protein n=1 Tax=Phytophthora megakarya TaxID=4795 RepID=A0A225UML2_9STRA|nr:hypothetical protein PHMEG_00035956 [Phytophthora megakarya]
MADDEEKPRTDERLEQQEVSRLIREALTGRWFPPVAQYPEATRGDGLLSSPFSWPVVVWVPECENRLQKPYCLKTGRSCSPRLKEYRQRAVKDVDTKYNLLYIKCQCTGDSKGCFSTVNATFVQRDARLLIHFPFIMTKKSGLSKDLMELVHDRMTSPHGISSAVPNIRRRHEKRYYKLLCLFANVVRHRRLTNPLYLPPTPPSVGQYMYLQKPLGTEILTAAWLRSTSIYNRLCEQVMSRTKVKKVLRGDHSVWPGGTGNRESMTDAKMLLFLQNEIDPIVGRRLTRSDNHSKTRELLEHTKGALQRSAGPVQRFTEKVKG